MPRALRTFIQADGSIADVPPNEARMRIRVKSRVNQSIPGVIGESSLIRREGGKDPEWHEFVVAKSAMPQVMELVETEQHKLDLAREAAENQFNAWISSHGGKESPAYNEKTWGGSVEKVFYENFGRGIKPLLEVEVLEDNMPPPLMPIQVGISPQTVAAPPAEGGPHQDAILAELKALRSKLEEQDKTIDALKSNLASASRPKRFKG